MIAVLALGGRVGIIESSQPVTSNTLLNALQDPSVSSGEFIPSPSILEDLYDGADRGAAIKVS